VRIARTLYGYPVATTSFRVVREETPALAAQLFFFSETATTEIYTLSLHDALPISFGGGRDVLTSRDDFPDSVGTRPDVVSRDDRSEEHTSELQSQSNLVCRLLLEKKNKHNTATTAARGRAGCDVVVSTLIRPACAP